jgi:hypothetical protein
VSAEQAVDAGSAEAGLVMVRPAERDALVDVEMAGRLALLVEPISGPVTMKNTFIGWACS